MKRSPADLMAMVVAELVKGPATIGALCRALGVSPTKSDKVQVYLKPLRAAGAVRICGWLTQQQPVMALQTAPPALPDEPMPPKREPKRKTARRLDDAGRAPVPLGPNSVFALGAP